jgi:hypothetical protein
VLTAAVALAALSQAAFSFVGGSEASFAGELQKAVKKPVVLLSTGDPIPPIKVDSNITLESFRRLVRTRAGMEPGGAILGLSRPSWPEGFYFRQSLAYAKLQRQPEAQDVEAHVQGAKVLHIRSTGGSWSLEQLRQKTAFNVTWHPYYDPARVVISAEDCTTQEVLEAVAAAIGARLTQSEGRFRLNFDPQSYRRRATALLSQPLAPSAGIFARSQHVDNLFAVAFLKNISDDTITRFIDGWDGAVVFQPRHPVHESAMARLDVRFEMFAKDGRGNGNEDALTLFRKVDRDQRVRAMLRPDGLASCEYRLSTGGWLGF